MMIGGGGGVTPNNHVKKRSRKNSGIGGNENEPLLPKSHHQEDNNNNNGDFKGASFSSAVFNLSTTIIGAGIMALPATLKVLGMVPGLITIIFMAFLTDKSVEFIIRFSRAGGITSYGDLMGDAFGKFGKALLQISVIINNLGILVVYMIIIGDVLSGTSSNKDHHYGILEGWFGVHWWTGRKFVLLVTTLTVLLPLVSFKRIDSLSFTSAISIALAVVFLVIAVGIAIVKIISGGIGMPRLFPVINDFTDFFQLFTVAPILVTAYICHYNVHNIENEMEDKTEMHGVVRTSLGMCCSVYLLTSFFGFLLFGEETLDDVIANFDADLGIPFGFAINDAVRFSYAAHLMLVFPVVFFPLRINLDGLISSSSSSSRPLLQDNLRFTSITIALVLLIFVGANFIPTIWDAFQFTGATATVFVGFIFPAALTLRDRYDIATKQDKILSVMMMILAVFSNAMAIYSDAVALVNKDKTKTFK
ncbi:Amino acid transporter avt6b [Stylosanthes scabra]|uniref:Amino acid transporter avt6b n=1 Tax=Stylosanthes scabra TaxID=79078 RepID=A0ABU6YRD6_9FABA|nr:Amino acid transporter avt6b [Stylosanthes scabra]